MHADRIYALIDDGLGRAAGGALLFSDPLRVLACRDAQNLAPAFETIRAAAANGLWCVVLADYELGYLLEPKVLGRPYRSIEPLLTVLVCGQPNTLDGAGLQAWLAAGLAAVPEERRFCGVADIRPGIAEDDYAEHVERIRRYIAAGDCYQVNLTYP